MYFVVSRGESKRKPNRMKRRKTAGIRQTSTSKANPRAKKKVLSRWPFLKRADKKGQGIWVDIKRKKTKKERVPLFFPLLMDWSRTGSFPPMAQTFQGGFAEGGPFPSLFLPFFLMAWA